jgi:NADH-quinone oxidoreductase subunit G
VPLPHIFGSGEFTAESPALASLAPGPWVALNPEDAAGLDVVEGGAVYIGESRGIVKIVPELPRGVAGVPAGMAPFAAPPPEWSAIAKVL